MMARLLLDATVLIDALRGRPTATRLASLWRRDLGELTNCRRMSASWVLYARRALRTGRRDAR